MSDTTDCDADAVPKTGRRADPFGLDLDLDPASGPDADFALQGHVEEYDNAPDECTIFPRTASADLPRTTAWLTAEEGSYCSLEDAR
ncbi:DUF7511 domain-containing protein [Salinigranum sp. GCM10025319]|uniref:DUF7511 domain-containing protein n=1 Tax=Salinigranum sp. GCM10025319 TaxID=3252687 RepID=UPI003619075A